VPRIGAQPRLQAGTQRPGGIPLVRSARGVMMRGVVVRTYSFNADERYACMDRRSTPAAQYADVLCYTSMRGGRYHYLPRCLISREYSGAHDGDISTPRPNRHGFGQTPDVNTKTSPAMMDGDHVLVGFIDDRCEQGVILRHIPHPRADTGKAPDAASGDRLRIIGDGVTDDGTPRAIKHQGVVVGVTANGGWLLDLRRAHLGFGGGGTANTGGGYDANTGDEVASTQIDTQTNYASAGNVRVRLPDDAVFSVDYGDGSVERISLLHHAAGQSTMALMADYVRIGSPAAAVVSPEDAAVRGTAWGDARNTLYRDVDTRLGHISTAADVLKTAAGNFAGSSVSASQGSSTVQVVPATASAALGGALEAFLIVLKGQLEAIKLSIDSFERPTTGADQSAEEANAYLSNHVYFVEEA